MTERERSASNSVRQAWLAGAEHDRWAHGSRPHDLKALPGLWRLVRYAVTKPGHVTPSPALAAEPPQPAVDPAPG